VKLDRKLLAQAWAAYLPLALTIALGVAGGVLTVIQARALSQIIDRAFLHGAALPALTPLLVTLLFIIAGRALATYGSEVSASQVAARVKTDLRERLFAHLLTLGPLYARGERTGELSNVATEGIEALDAYFSQYLPQLALAALVPLIILGFVFPLDPLSGLVLLLTAPLIPVFMILIGSLADAPHPQAVGRSQPHERPLPGCAARADHAQDDGAQPRPDRHHRSGHRPLPRCYPQRLARRLPLRLRTRDGGDDQHRRGGG
jgi:ATP-binding cassette subfamily C protein CydD